MTTNSFSTQGFSDGEKALAREIGTREAPLAIRLRNHMVASRSSAGAVGPIRLQIHIPPTIADESTARRWTQNFFEEAFGSAQGIAVDHLPTQQNTLIGVQLSDAAAGQYRAMMHDLDRTQAVIDAREHSAAR